MNHDVLRSIVRYANLVTKGRVAIQKNDGDSSLEAEAAEAPQRIIKSLQMISAAIALIHGRFEVDSEDLRIIRHIAFSSLPERRRKALRALLASGGTLTVTQAESELNISRPTALNYMKELAATAIVDFHPGDQAKNVPGKITLQQKWQWLIDDQTSADPLNESDVRALEDKKEKEIETNVRPSRVYFKGVFDPSVDCESEQLALAEAWEIESSFHYWTIEELLEVGHA